MFTNDGYRISELFRVRERHLATEQSLVGRFHVCRKRRAVFPFPDTIALLGDFHFEPIIDWRATKRII